MVPAALPKLETRKLRMLQKSWELAVRENLEFSDGFFVNNVAHQLEIIKILRKYRPEIVLCNAIEDRHIDHGKGAQLVATPVF